MSTQVPKLLRAVDREVQFKSYLKQALLGAQVVRPSGTYTGHYNTGALYNSINSAFKIKKSTSRSFTIDFTEQMLPYGFELSDGYQAEPITFAQISAWASKKSLSEDYIDNIYAALRRRPFREGSKWIEDAEMDFIPAYSGRVQNRAIEAVLPSVYAYMNYNLEVLFGNK